MASLIALTALTVYLLIRAMFGCMMSLGCDTVSSGAFIAGILGLVLVALPYFVFMAPQAVFGDFDLPTSVMMGILIVTEIIYLYLLSCVIEIAINKFREKRKDRIVKNGKKEQQRLNIIIFVSFAVIILIDGLAFSRRLYYVLALTDGASLIIEKFSTALKITALSIFEIWYLVFLFLRRKKVTWNKVLLAVIWIVALVLLALNIMMLGFSF